MSALNFRIKRLEIVRRASEPESFVLPQESRDCVDELVNRWEADPVTYAADLAMLEDVRRQCRERALTNG